MATTTVHRDHSGVRIEGTHYSVWLYPALVYQRNDSATLLIGVDATSRRWDGWARLGSDEPNNFAAGDVELVQTPAGTDELRCLRASDQGAAAYRSGFVLTLEPGMRAFLETELPRIERVAQTAMAVQAAVEPLLGRTLQQYALTTVRPDEADAIARFVARVVLDGEDPETALRFAVRLHDRWAFSGDGDDPQYAELGAALRRPEIPAILTQHANHVES